MVMIDIMMCDKSDWSSIFTCFSCDQMRMNVKMSLRAKEMNIA